MLNPMLRRVTLFLSTALSLYADDSYPPARFTDPNRVGKLQSAFHDVDTAFRDYAAARRIPGMAWGIVIDDRVAHTGAAGVRDLATHSAVDSQTVFRIASMTKSFTAIAVLKLRDQGKLSLEDPVSRWVPEFNAMPLPTRDTAPLRIRQLLSHSAGFPEDNPWGDRQLAASDADLTRWLKLGIPFSTPPDTQYEYSNYAFGLLGRIVTRASGMPYERYVQTEILDKLGMKNSTFEFASVPESHRAKGYRLQPDGAYKEETPLAHGAFGSMGGLLTDSGDLGKYIAFQLSAWPPRDDGERGPLRRSSLREMNHLWRPANLTVKNGAPSSGGYGYGLRIASDCRFSLISAHGGGLPGFGSYMLWLPDYGVGLFAMANLTYSGPTEPINRALDVLSRTGGLQPRQLPPSPVLRDMRDRIASFWKTESDGDLQDLAAMNLLLDKSAIERRHEIHVIKKDVGACKPPGEVQPENWLRGRFTMACEHGNVAVQFTLAPTAPPRVQHLSFLQVNEAQLRSPATCPNN